MKNHRESKEAKIPDAHPSSLECLTTESAIVMGKLGVDLPTAQALLSKAGGFTRKAIALGHDYR